MNIPYKDNLDRFTLNDNNLYKQCGCKVSFSHATAIHILLIFNRKEILFFDSLIGEDIMRLPLLEGHINDNKFTSRVETYWHEAKYYSDECLKEVMSGEICVTCANVCNKRLIIDFILTHPRIFEIDPHYNSYKDIIYNNIVLDALRKKYIYLYFKKNQNDCDKNALINAALKWLNICTSDQPDNRQLFKSANRVFGSVEEEVNDIFFNKCRLELGYLEHPIRGEINNFLTNLVDEGQRWYISRRYLWRKSFTLSRYRSYNSDVLGQNEYPFLTLMPRMMGAIIVGYLPLVLSPEVWGVTLELTRFDNNGSVTYAIGNYSLIIILCCLLASVYNYIEIRKYVKNETTRVEKDNKRTIVRTVNPAIRTRAAIITLIGIMYSWVFGLIVIPCMTYLMVRQLHEKALHYAYVNFSTTAKFALFSSMLWAPIALCIGLFLQILWEDKPITDPL